MPVYIHDIATAVPPHASRQQHIREVMKQHVSTDRKSEAIIHRIYSQSGIETRHSVIEDFVDNHHGSLFFNGEAKENPGTSARNKVYEQESKKLFIEVGQKLLEGRTSFSKEDITHVITVSCTGFYAPGPDYELVKSLGLSPSTQRFHVGFMGCYGAFPAMKMAQSFCTADPDAVVLLVSAELCTLHFQFNNDIDHLLSGSVFADGAAGLLVSAQSPQKQALEFQHFASSLVPDAEKDMAWTIGDTGFNMVLSSYVPDIIQKNMQPVLEPLFQQLQLSKDDIDHWALHPGGRAILDKIEQTMELQPDQLKASRQVLSRYGNMSSATILFVLKTMMDAGLSPNQQILSMAFGPGLTIESGLLRVHQPEENK
ncbi:type III polyketide synthase [Gracilimonas mengyeensis]|uniref:Predicted naringenin-chalcone synthase n=1 Tax=Gracilimonas mengyeensis TaxID=1302730 RepID=A0A521FKT4_9BACT|nr:type III polyketide synthase [Gracilimonas mengyeensis]SMO96101.1 Predicted naringenin-chalcone synthase [Gracilimonas mengyeensis]